MIKKYYNYHNFFNIDKDKKFDKNNLIIIKNFEVFQQLKDNTCGPCCANMVLNFYGDKTFSEDKIKKIMKTKKFPIGTDFNDFYNFFEKYIESNKNFKLISSINSKKNKNGQAFSTFKKFKQFVLNYLKMGCPIIVENVDYGGHYKIIIGYDISEDSEEEDMLIFADPFSKIGGYAYQEAERFYYMWFDAKCFSKENRCQPFLILQKIK